MTLASALSACFALNVAVAAACTALLAIEFAMRRWSARKLLSLHYQLAAVVIASALACASLPQHSLVAPSAHIWSSQDFHAATASPHASGAYLTVANIPANLDAGSVSRVWIATALALLVLGILRLARDLQSLRALRRDSVCIRRLGRVRVWVSEQASVPFSFWLPGGAHVIVPGYLVQTPKAFRMVLAHELQHHRQRDTLWLHVFRALRWLCVANPLVWLWSRRLARIQEFSCDEALASRRAWTAGEYAHCLLDVAAREVRHRTHSAWAAHFIRLGDPNVLTRRIEKMLNMQKRTMTRSLHLALVAAAAAMVTLSTWAASGTVQDRRISAAQAEQMASTLAARSGFQVVINEEVVQEINRYAGTPEGREFMRGALQRLDANRIEVSSALNRHGVPIELAAIPLVESGYRNLDASQNSLGAAGIWQFIPRTAQIFGLRVDGGVDQRLDTALASDAAARLLRSQQLRFEDWQLAVLAYNIGPNALQNALDHAGSHDAWTVVRGGLEDAREYLARVHAAILIAANPNLVTQ